MCPYALTVQNMCIKGVGDTFSSVLFLPEVGRGWQNVICKVKVVRRKKVMTSQKIFMPNPAERNF